MDGKTKVYGVMGDPIEHSMSPLMHNFYAELMCALPLFTGSLRM